MKIRSEKPKAQRSIAGRLTRAVLIPSVALLVMWLGVSVYLLYDAFYARAVASSVREVSIPAVNGLASAQQERQLGRRRLRTRVCHDGGPERREREIAQPQRFALQRRSRDARTRDRRGHASPS